MSERKLPHQSSKLVSGQVWVLRGLSLAGTDSELSFSLGNLGHLKSWYGGWPYTVSTILRAKHIVWGAGCREVRHIVAI